MFKPGFSWLETCLVSFVVSDAMRFVTVVSCSIRFTDCFIMKHFLWESNAFWEILVIMAVIAVVSSQFPKRIFLNVLQHTNIMRYSLHLFVAFDHF